MATETRNRLLALIPILRLSGTRPEVRIQIGARGLQSVADISAAGNPRLARACRRADGRNIFACPVLAMCSTLILIALVCRGFTCLSAYTRRRKTQGAPLRQHAASPWQGSSCGKVMRPPFPANISVLVLYLHCPLGHRKRDRDRYRNRRDTAASPLTLGDNRKWRKKQLACPLY